MKEPLIECTSRKALVLTYPHPVSIERNLTSKFQRFFKHPFLYICFIERIEEIPDSHSQIPTGDTEEKSMNEMYRYIHIHISTNYRAGLTPGPHEV